MLASALAVSLASAVALVMPAQLDMLASLTASVVAAQLAMAATVLVAALASALEAAPRSLLYQALLEEALAE